MIISEKQIMQLMEYLNLSLNEILTIVGKERAYVLMDIIREQQSEELEEIE
jgi:hypothetical protein